MRKKPIKWTIEGLKGTWKLRGNGTFKGVMAIIKAFSAKEIQDA